MSTQVLLGAGVAATALFVAVLFAEGARRTGYDPAYHTGSELSLGERGWVQIANFLQMGVAMLAFAVGVGRTLDAPVGAALLGVFGLGLLVSGVCVPDAIRGYPPGSPAGPPPETSWHHQVHSAAGPIMFLALLAACVLLARHLQGAWRLYTLLTALTGLALTAWTAAAWQRDAAHTGLVQRGLILVYWTWLALLGTHLLL